LLWVWFGTWTNGGGNRPPTSGKSGIHPPQPQALGRGGGENPQQRGKFMLGLSIILPPPTTRGQNLVWVDRGGKKLQGLWGPTPPGVFVTKYGQKKKGGKPPPKICKSPSIMGSPPPQKKKTPKTKKARTPQKTHNIGGGGLGPNPPTQPHQPFGPKKPPPKKLCNGKKPKKKTPQKKVPTTNQPEKNKNKNGNPLVSKRGTPWGAEAPTPPPT